MRAGYYPGMCVSALVSCSHVAEKVRRNCGLPTGRNSRLWWLVGEGVGHVHATNTAALGTDIPLEGIC